MKKSIRIYHNLARSGGTVISKCIASMKQITLLSEVHPYIETVNPTYSKDLLSQNILTQARYWHNLFTKEDIQNLLSKLSTIAGPKHAASQVDSSSTS